MAITKEYRCFSHGPFDSTDGICPHGCDTVVREFRTAPSGRSDKSKAIDRNLEGLAKRFGLTEMSNKNGSVGGGRKAPDEMAPLWGSMPKGNVYSPGKGETHVDGSQGGATAALSGMGIGAATAAEMMKAKYPDRDFAPEPTFMEIAKGLPKLRPTIHGTSGSSADLARAIESTP